MYAAAERPVHKPAHYTEEPAAPTDMPAASSWQPLNPSQMGQQQNPAQTEAADQSEEQIDMSQSLSWNDKLTQRLNAALQNVQPNLSVKTNIGRAQPDRRHTAVT